jgi:hypothetical protein
MEIGLLLQLVLKDDKVIPMEIVSKYAQTVDQKVKNGSTYRDPVVTLHFRLGYLFQWVVITLALFALCLLFAE